MSGHSKWATTKHKKAAIDAKRGKLFAKLIKNIEVAARSGGGDPAGNPTLYDAIQKAKKSSVPNNNIDNAVKRGSGADGRRVRLGDHHLRGLRARRGRGAHRVPHRQPQPRRRRGAHRPDPQRRRPGRPGLGAATSSSARASSSCPSPTQSEDDLLEVVLDAGAEEVNDNGDTWEIVSEATDFVAVRTALQEAGVDYDSAEASWVPTLQVPLDLDGAKKMIRVIEALEDSDDVQDVFANGDIPDDVLAAARRGVSRGRDTSDAVASGTAEAPAFDEAPDHGLLDADVRAAWRDLLLGVLPPAPAAVADLGCGTGTLARAARRARVRRRRARLLARHGAPRDREGRMPRRAAVRALVTVREW